ncbi:hypothetical protein H0G86_005524 [Trichoderma simmonsii]|uniref:Uncharacterized protein n=1 Tax=Trichoderma simmonsii TaxID=1491479 RepID=A0A8G0PD61_9HYPO|nr:hypothetical protein H0G86_005524 [Trichoderma simmonsii]
MPSVILRWVSRTCYPSAYRLRIVTMVAEGASTAPSLFDSHPQAPPCHFTLAFPERCPYSRNKTLLSCFFLRFLMRFDATDTMAKTAFSRSLFDCAHKGRLRPWYIHTYVNFSAPFGEIAIVVP